VQDELLEVLTLLAVVAEPAFMAIHANPALLWGRAALESGGRTTSITALIQLYRAGVLPRLKRAAAQPWLHARWGASAAEPLRCAARARRQLAAAAEGGAQPRVRHGSVEGCPQQGDEPACCMRRLGRSAACEWPCPRVCAPAGGM
jgi:hypothetical protein